VLPLLRLSNTQSADPPAAARRAAGRRRHCRGGSVRNRGVGVGSRSIRRRVQEYMKEAASGSAGSKRRLALRRDVPCGDTAAARALGCLGGGPMQGDVKALGSKGPGQTDIDGTVNSD
jgi:hypothetical protein